MKSPHNPDGMSAGQTAFGAAPRAGFWTRLVDLAQLLQACQARCLP